jgi:hypothetical protein
MNIFIFNLKYFKYFLWLKAIYFKQKAMYIYIQVAYKEKSSIPLKIVTARTWSLMP